MKGKKVMHPQSVVLQSLINITPDFNIDRFLDDMGVERVKPDALKNFIKISSACKLLEISTPKLYKLVAAGMIKIKYIGGDKHNARVKESNILNLMVELEDVDRVKSPLSNNK